MNFIRIFAPLAATVLTIYFVLDMILQAIARFHTARDKKLRRGPWQ